MRKVTFGVAASLDLYIAREDHSVDWLQWSDEVGAFVAEFWKSIDTVVMGRRTYEAGVRQGMKAYDGVRNIVISSTMTEAAHPRVEIVREDAVAFVRSLQQSEGKDICIMGGGILAHQLFEADAIDEVGVNVHPVLLGSGVPLFHRTSRQIDLRMTECRPFRNGCVLLRYAVANHQRD
jgi:dihydrofolate reductase